MRISGGRTGWETCPSKRGVDGRLRRLIGELFDPNAQNGVHGQIFLLSAFGLDRFKTGNHLANAISSFIINVDKLEPEPEQSVMRFSVNVRAPV